MNESLRSQSAGAGKNLRLHLEIAHAKALGALLDGSADPLDLMDARGRVEHYTQNGVAPAFASQQATDMRTGLAREMLRQKWPENTAPALKEIFEMYLREGMVLTKTPPPPMIGMPSEPALYGSPVVVTAVNLGHMDGLEVVLNNEPAKHAYRTDPRPLVNLVAQAAERSAETLRNPGQMHEYKKAEVAQQFEDQKRMLQILIDRHPDIYVQTSLSDELLTREGRAREEALERANRSFMSRIFAPSAAKPLVNQGHVLAVVAAAERGAQGADLLKNRDLTNEPEAIGASKSVRPTPFGLRG